MVGVRTNNGLLLRNHMAIIVKPRDRFTQHGNARRHSKAIHILAFLIVVIDSHLGGCSCDGDGGRLPFLLCN